MRFAKDPWIICGALMIVCGVALAAATDPWGTVPVGSGGVNGLTVPGQDAVAVTPSATVDLARVPRAIYSHDGGNIACRFATGNSMIFLFAAGEIKPLRCARVLVSGTDSTVIGALY